MKLKGLAACAMALSLLTVPATMLSGKQNISHAATNVPIGVAGWCFDQVTTKASNKFIEKAHTAVFHNTQSYSVPYTWTGSETVSSSASASGSLGGGWGPINASVSETANTSVSDTWTEESSVNVPANGYGWYKFGIAQTQWYGHYYYQDIYGNESSSEWINVYSPRYTEYENATSTTSPTNP
jgi:hypothetical protein